MNTKYFFLITFLTLSSYFSLSSNATTDESADTALTWLYLHPNTSYAWSHQHQEWLFIESMFDVKFKSANTGQRYRTINSSLPPGVSTKLKGVYCKIRGQIYKIRG